MRIGAPRLLLDAHAFLWWLAGDEKLSVDARGATGEELEPIFVRTASPGGISTRHRLGKLPGASAIFDGLVLVSNELAFGASLIRRPSRLANCHKAVLGPADWPIGWQRHAGSGAALLQSRRLAESGVLGANDGIISTASLIMGGGGGARRNPDRGGRGLGGGRDVDGGGRICLRQLAGRFRDRRS